MSVISICWVFLLRKSFEESRIFLFSLNNDVMKHEGTTFSSYFSRSFHDFSKPFPKTFCSWLRSTLRPSWKFSVASGLPIASRPTECEVSCYSWSRMVTTTLLDLA